MSDSPSSSASRPNSDTTSAKIDRTSSSRWHWSCVVEVLPARIGPRTGEGLDVGRIEVVAQQELADRAQPVRAVLVVHLAVDRQVSERQLPCRRSCLVGCLGGFDDEQTGPGLHLIVAVHVDLANGAGELGADGRLHLHGLDHRQSVTDLDGRHPRPPRATPRHPVPATGWLLPRRAGCGAVGPRLPRSA